MSSTVDGRRRRMDVIRYEFLFSTFILTREKLYASSMHLSGCICMEILGDGCLSCSNFEGTKILKQRRPQLEVHVIDQFQYQVNDEALPQLEFPMLDPLKVWHPLPLRFFATTFSLASGRITSFALELSASSSPFSASLFT